MDRDLRLIEEQHPLIHNITNYVAMNFVANSLLAIGASPIMARAQEEVEEICSKSNALALNLGILESETAHSMLLAGKAASKSRIPIVSFNASQQSSRVMPVKYDHYTRIR